MKALINKLSLYDFSIAKVTVLFNGKKHPLPVLLSLDWRIRERFQAWIVSFGMVSNMLMVFSKIDIDAPPYCYSIT